MRKQKENLRKHSIHHYKEKDKILRSISKETKDLDIENYKTLMKEIKEDTNRW